MTRDSAAEQERWQVLRRLEHWLERPMVVLGFAWLALLILELTRGLGPVLGALGTAIWVVFIVEFVVRLASASCARCAERRSTAATRSTSCSSSSGATS